MVSLFYLFQKQPNCFPKWMLSKVDFTFPPVICEGSSFDWNYTESVDHYGKIAVLTLSSPVHEYEVFSLSFKIFCNLFQQYFVVCCMYIFYFFCQTSSIKYFIRFCCEWNCFLNFIFRLFIDNI